MRNLGVYVGIGEDHLKERDSALEEAGSVGTIVNAKGSPLTTITEPGKVSIEAALKNPRVAAAVSKYKTWFAHEADPNFKVAQKIADDIDLPTRGEKTGARVNLMAIDPDEAGAEAAHVAGVSDGKASNAYKQRSPFAQTAKGTAKAYEIRLSKMIENTLSRGTEAANKRRMFDQLVKDGVAVYGKPGENPTIGGKPTVGIDVKNQTLLKENGEVIPRKEVLWVRSDAHSEINQALNTDSKPYSKTLAFAAVAATKSALVSLGESTAHLANQLSAVLGTPGASVGRWLTNGVKLAMNNKGSRQILADLARIGAVQESHTATEGYSKYNPLKQIGRGIQFTGRAARLTLNDAFDKQLRKGRVEDSETNRRDAINQLGQYNARAQSSVVALSRRLTTGPFATASSNFYSLGISKLAMSPGMKASSLANAAILRGQVLARFGAALGAVAAWNYFKWGRVDGGNNVPLGAIRLDDDEDGKVRYRDILGFFPQMRGLRETGLMAQIEGARRGDRMSDRRDASAKAIAGGFISPFAGPIINEASILGTGYDTHLYRVAHKAKKNEAQFDENAKAALLHLNPLVDAATGGRTNQLGRFGVKTGRPDESLAVIQAHKTLASNGDFARSPEQQKKHDAEKELVKQLREPGANQTKLLRDAIDNGTITRSDVNRVRTAAKRSDLENMVKDMDPADAARIYGLATPKERATLHDQVREKILASDTSAAQQDAMLSRLGIAPPVDLHLNRELHALNQQAHDAAEGKKLGDSLIRQSAIARQEGDADRAESLRVRAVDTIRSSQLSPQDDNRRQRLESAHKVITQTRQRVLQGTMDKAAGDAMIERMLRYAGVKRAA